MAGWGNGGLQSCTIVWKWPRLPFQHCPLDYRPMQQYLCQCLYKVAVPALPLPPITCETECCILGSHHEAPCRFLNGARAAFKMVGPCRDCPPICACLPVTKMPSIPCPSAFILSAILSNASHSGWVPMTRECLATVTDSGKNSYKNLPICCFCSQQKNDGFFFFLFQAKSPGRCISQLAACSASHKNLCLHSVVNTRSITLKLSKGSGR